MAFDEKEQSEFFIRICSPDPKEQAAYWKWLETRTENLLNIHWKEVTAVANSLLERKTLTYEDVYEIISGKPMPKFTTKKNSWVEEIMGMIKRGEITAQEAIDEAEAETVQAESKDEEKWLLSSKRYNINMLKKELKKEGFVCKEVWQDNRST